MQAILKKYRFLIFGGLVLVAFFYISNVFSGPIANFLTYITESWQKTTVQKKPHWRRFTNSECGFAVSFPSHSFEHPYKLTNNSQRIMFYRQFASVLGSNQVFLVATLKTSNEYDFSQAQVKLLMDKTMAGAMGTDDTLIYQRDITYGTNPGREFEFQKPDKNFVKMRYYRVPFYFQTLTVLVPFEDKDSTNASYFFDSFNLLSQ
jgi:hypothetical protein